jgi:hypothetical protein
MIQTSIKRDVLQVNTGYSSVPDSLLKDPDANVRKRYQWVQDGRRSGWAE